MRAVLTVEMDGAAFEDAPASELARLLREVATAVKADGAGALEPYPITDWNGNRVGQLVIEE